MKDKTKKMKNKIKKKMSEKKKKTVHKKNLNRIFSHFCQYNNPVSDKKPLTYKN